MEHTTQESQAIEVEVVEIDGVTAPIRNRPTEESPPPRPGPDWRRWPGRVTTLDAKWWPLWVLLGIIALALLLTFGLVFGVIFVIFRVIKGILNAIFG